MHFLPIVATRLPVHGLHQRHSPEDAAVPDAGRPPVRGPHDVAVPQVGRPPVRHVPDRQDAAPDPRGGALAPPAQGHEVPGQPHCHTLCKYRPMDSSTTVNHDHL